MKTIKGSKKDLIKEYKNYCNDMKNYNQKPTKERFTKDFINMNIKTYGILNNVFFKTTNIEEVQNEIYKILKEI